MGRDISDDDLRLAIETHDHLRTLLSTLMDLRRTRPAHLTGTRALYVISATTAIPVHRSIELLERLLADTSRFPTVSGVRAFLTGSGHDTPDVYASLERTGWLITGEDHDWGEALFHRRVAAPTLLALAERYQHNGPSAPRASIQRRAARTASAAAAAGAEALISYVRAQDNAPPWDFAAQRQATGLPAILVDGQPYAGLCDAARDGVERLRVEGNR